MNFLAHFFLSRQDESLMMGNFLADYLENRQVGVLPEPIREGVRLHRLIDSFTDNHDMVRQGTNRLRPMHGKYAPVVIDILYDYLLAVNWERYHPLPLPEFTQSVYRVLEKYLSIMPPVLQERTPRMIEADWLLQYGTLEGLEFTFSKVRNRTSNPVQLDGAVQSLIDQFEWLDAEFNAFFPEVTAFVDNNLATLRSGRTG